MIVPSCREFGNISSLTWEEKFGLYPAKAEDQVAEVKPQAVELPARVYTMLTALIVIGVLLVILTFLRH
jgi:hypothetical protein